MTHPPPPTARAPEQETLSRQLTGSRSPIIWGVLLLIAIEGMLFALFVVSYFYLRLGADVWPPPGVTPPNLLVPTIGQVLLVTSVLPIWLALRDLPRGRTRALTLGLPVGVLLAFVHLLLKAAEYAERGYRWDAHVYGSLDWAMSGYSILHVVTVVLAGLVVWAFALRGRFGRDRYTGVQAMALYWTFAAAGSVAFYLVQHLSPRL